ncbi:MAG: DUF1302 family protein [Candidatus Binatia bacterium]
MVGRSTQQVGYRLCSFLVFLLCMPALAWGSLRVGNAEIQVFYAQNHQFLYDNNTYGIDWVQFRNELSVKFTYEKLINEGMLFDQIQVPYADRAHFFTYYRGRYDPIYLIRKKYRGMLDKETRENFVFPENEFREFFLDVDFDQTGPGKLSMRLGRQQIVWGESDLFRSLDIINPLRVDQSSLVGERFDDYRTPLWFIKFLYDLGTVGPISEIGIEPFYTANWQPLESDALVPGVKRLRQNDIERYAGVSPTAGGFTFRRKGHKPWQNFVRSSVPWAVTRQSSNQEKNAPAYVCLFSYNCDDREVGGVRVSDTRGERIGAHFVLEDDKVASGGHGWDVHHRSMAGVRVLGKTGFGVDFSLNYLFKRAEAAVVPEMESLVNRDLSLATLGLPGPGRGILVPRTDIIYGAGLPGQDIYTGIARCAGSSKPLKGMPGAPAGVFSSKGERIGNIANREGAVLVGADMFGYNSNADPDDDIGIGAGALTTLLGNPAGLDLSGVGPLIPITLCGEARLKHPWTHVMAFTMTYNDFDYTGAIFRLEQSFSTKEARLRWPIVFHRAADITNLPESQVRDAFTSNYTAYTGVWRSMMGFDLIRSLGSFPGMRWAKYMPGDIGNQVMFYTFQYLTEYQMDNFSNNAPGAVGPLCLSLILKDRCNRTNHAFTFAVAGVGYFRGAFDPLAAIGWDLNVDSPLLVYRMFWHGLFGNKKLDFYGGTAVFMGSVNQGSWLLLNQFADKDVLWLRLIYYLL